MVVTFLYHLDHYLDIDRRCTHYLLLFVRYIPVWIHLYDYNNHISYAWMWHLDLSWKNCSCLPIYLPGLHTPTSLLHFSSIHRTILRFRVFLCLFGYILFPSANFQALHLFWSYTQYLDISKLNNWYWFHVF